MMLSVTTLTPSANLKGKTKKNMGKIKFVLRLDGLYVDPRKYFTSEVMLFQLSSDTFGFLLQRGFLRFQVLP